MSLPSSSAMGADGMDAWRVKRLDNAALRRSAER